MPGGSMAQSKQTPEVLAAICGSLRLGIPFSRSCKSAGISEVTGRGWRRAGWSAIEEAAPDEGGPLSFVARFAIEVESALVEFMAPLVARLRDESTGKALGDWRYAKELLASRFPGEWSEKVHAAKSGRLEIAGEVGFNAHGYDQFLALRKMTYSELLCKSEQIQAQINHDPIAGQDLDDEIVFLEGKVEAMRDALAGNRSFTPANWLVGRAAQRPIAIDLERDRYEVSGAAPTGRAPIEPGALVVVPDAPGDLPEIARPRVRTGIGYDADSGLAIEMYDDDQDVVLP